MKTKTLLILFLLFFVHLNAFATEPLDDILYEHGLISKGEKHNWKILEMQKKESDLLTDKSQIEWINKVTANKSRQKNINASEFLKYRSVRTILDKSERAFQYLINMSQAYDRIARDMDHIHRKASILYNAETKSPKEDDLKKAVLKKVKKIYMSLRDNTITIYKQGLEVENILKLLPKKLTKARSQEISNKTLGMEYAHEYDLNMLKSGKISAGEILDKSDTVTDRILKESKTAFHEALYELDRKF